MRQRHPSQTPMAVLSMGLVTIAVFGIGLVQFQQKTPVLQLGPALEEALKVEGIEASVEVPDDPLLPPIVVVDLPEAAAPTRLDKLRVAQRALEEYRKITPKTRTDTVHVGVVGRPDEPREVLTHQQAIWLERAQSGLATLVEALLRGLPTRDAQGEIFGLDADGVHVRIQFELAKPEEVPPHVRRRMRAYTYVSLLELRWTDAEGQPQQADLRVSDP